MTNDDDGDNIITITKQQRASSLINPTIIITFDFEIDSFLIFHSAVVVFHICGRTNKIKSPVYIIHGSNHSGRGLTVELFARVGRRDRLLVFILGRPTASAGYGFATESNYIHGLIL